MGADILCIGEVLIELGPEQPGGGHELGLGGGELTSALHLVGMLEPGRVGFVGCMGDDPFSHRLRAELDSAGLDLSLCEATAGTTGSMAATTDGPDGAPVQVVWRADDPGHRAFDGPGAAARLSAIAGARAVYLTGAALAALPGPARLRVLNQARAAARKGTMIFFDPATKPETWRDPAAAAEWCARAYRAASVVLVSEADEEALFGRVPPPVGEKLLRRADGSVRVLAPALGLDAEVQAEAGLAEDAVFNAAYIAARAGGADPFHAAQAAARHRPQDDTDGNDGQASAIL